MINIAIDGFCGSGKSTLTKLLKQRLKDFKILDTGAIFRGIAYAFLSSKLGQLNKKNLTQLLSQIDLKIKFVKDEQKIIINGKDVTNFLRTEEIGQMASKISVFPQVREKYLMIAQNFAQNYNCIMEGRDIATVVMPNADVKFFLTADVKIRAQRRFDEIKVKQPNITYQEVLKDIKQRDKRDTSRKEAPLQLTEDSIVVDNSDMNLEETADYCYEIINKVLANNKINIAIDGYVCSGKSTIARALAKKLNFKVLDTGALYRAVACAFKYMNYNENQINAKTVCDFSKQINVDVEFIDDTQHTLVNCIDYTPFLRTEEISKLSAKLSPFNCVRQKVLNIQRNFAKQNNCVMEGRDIGSYVLPNADFKFFCTADENVRAKRRFEQQKALGNDVEFDDVLKELKTRDYNDVNRAHGAITVTPTSIILDTTNQSLDQSVDFCLKQIQKKFPKINIK